MKKFRGSKILQRKNQKVSKHKHNAKYGFWSLPLSVGFSKKSQECTFKFQQDSSHIRFSRGPFIRTPVIRICDNPDSLLRPKKYVCNCHSCILRSKNLKADPIVDAQSFGYNENNQRKSVFFIFFPESHSFCDHLYA